MDNQQTNDAFFQSINYSEHPAFAGLEDIDTYDEHAIAHHLEEIESRYFDLPKQGLSDKDIVGRFTKETADDVKSLKQLLEKGAPDSTIYELSCQVLDSAYQEVIKDLLFKNKTMTYKARPLSGQDLNHYEQVCDQGMSRFEITGKNKDAIATLGQQLREELVAKYEGNSTWRGANALTPTKGLGREVNKAMNTLNVPRILSEYKKCDMELVYIAADYSHERQNWWKGCYDDAGLELAETRYMHFDNDLDVAKVMFYLSDYVSEENGPTGFVRQSHSIKRSFIKAHIFAAMDRVPGKYFFKPEEDNYYRPLFKQQRQQLLRFPRYFRGSTHFGDDFVNGSEGSTKLLEKEFKLTGEVGTGVIFDGYKGIHRGSLVDSGERLALQIAFMDKSKLGTVQRLKKQVRSFLRI